VNSTAIPGWDQVQPFPGDRSAWPSSFSRTYGGTMAGTQIQFEREAHILAGYGYRPVHHEYRDHQFRPAEVVILAIAFLSLLILLIVFLMLRDGTLTVWYEEATSQVASPSFQAFPVVPISA
jgi:hypothetical protein